MNRWVRIAAALLAAAALTGAAGCGKDGTEHKKAGARGEKTKAGRTFIGESAVLPVKAVQARRIPASYPLRLPGVVQAHVESALSFRVPGLVTDLPVEIGQAVKRGDTIARLDASHYQNAVDQAQASVDQAQARWQDARAQYDRVRKLWADQDMSASQMDNARADTRAAEEGYRIAARQLAEARRELEYATLASPYDGIVADKQVRVFQTVEAGQPVVLLVDPGQVELRAQLPGSMLARKENFSNFRCVFPALGGLTLPAQIKGIGPSALPPNRTFPITVLLTRPPGTPVLPGTEGTLEITVTDPQPEEDILVPASAVVSDPGGQSLVWVVAPESGEVQPHPVQVEGLRDGDMALKTGVSPGQWVVTAGQDRLSPGRKVRIVKPVAAGG